MLVTTATPGNQIALDVVNIASGIFGILGSLYLSYDLLGRPRGFLRRFTAGISLGLIMGAVATVLALSVQQPLCAHLVCAGGTEPPVLVAVVASAMGAVLGFLMTGLAVTPFNYSVISLPKAALVGLLSGWLFGLAGFGFRLLQESVVGANVSFYASDLLLWQILLVPATVILSSCLPLVIERVDKLSRGQLGATGLLLIGLGFALQLAPSVADLASH
jgi:hypothetical protein